MIKKIQVRLILNMPLIFCSLFFTLFSTQLNAASKLVINTGSQEPYITANGGGFYGQIVKEIFKRLGIEAKTISLPSQRSLINANNGIDDGNIARIKGLEKKYPNLVRVPGKIIDFEFVVFSSGPEFNVDGWDSLKPYSIGHIKGWQILEKKVTSTQEVLKLRTAHQLFNLINTKRIDLIIYERWGSLWWVKKMKPDITQLQPALAKRELFMYLHKKHSSLVPEAAQALANMKNDGTYQRIFNNTLSVLLK